ncbi:hypothetical protein AC15_3855 [Escherichia coli 2-156-04_S3_C2]|nr:hypothetical protein AC15_3855 [Escherichia coli 2-156-04_S3_C2]
MPDALRLSGLHAMPGQISETHPTFHWLRLRRFLKAAQ